MIRFTLAPKPEGFVEKVERRGEAWLQANPAGRPYRYWSEFRSALADAFRNLCAYSAIYEPVGTVDHFVSCDEDRSRAYDWSNYRFASGWVNSSKQALQSAQVLDPFEVQDDWFEILLPSLQLVTTDRIPEEYQERAAFVLRRLRLQDGEAVIRQRRAWYQLYMEGKLTLEGLAERAPLIASAAARATALSAQNSKATDRGVENTDGDH